MTSPSIGAVFCVSFHGIVSSVFIFAASVFACIEKVLLRLNLKGQSTSNPTSICKALWFLPLMRCCCCCRCCRRRRCRCRCCCCRCCCCCCCCCCLCANGDNIPVQVGSEGLGAPFCKYRMVCPRCTSYNLAEPNVHRRNFLLQNGRLS